MKQNLLDTTFLIPVRLDSVVRLENLIFSMQYIQKHFSTHILILEAADYNNGFIERLIGKKVEYHFVEDRNPVFYRTKYLNSMAEMSNTPYLAIWDADVIIPKDQIMDSIEKLRNNNADMIYPYDGHFYDTSDPVRELYLKTRDVKVLYKNFLKMDLPYGAHMVGGAFMVNRIAYAQSGKENELFYGWGPEDGERFHRWKNLGMRVEHSFGNLYHLSHPRGTNSSFRSAGQRQHTQKELLLTQQSSKEEILQIINNQTKEL